MDSTKSKRKRINKDFETLGKLLGCKTATAKMRFYRQNEEAVEMMLKIVEVKEIMINENSPKKSINQ